ncbi:hypothetical protein [Microbacterium sp. SA39]|uniref:hypothetical protein n=1 Tax=Microbacterium sp. SA39 TaxID=1263625 RepID=UPI0005FA1B77|nr:hypothetical protein [Microbacterium sp. SA39]KJQ54148.1 hypothetical protein RS85_02219 [Microbacterium sp. SA39]
MTHTEDPTDDQVVSAFTNFLDERAKAGVLLAVGAEVGFDSGTVTVTLHPEVAVPDPDALMSLSPFGNHAEFAGTPIAFANEESDWLRRAVKRVDTRLPDGTDLGSLSAAELHQLGAGKPLPPSE